MRVESSGHPGKVRNESAVYVTHSKEAAHLSLRACVDGFLKCLGVLFGDLESPWSDDVTKVINCG